MNRDTFEKEIGWIHSEKIAKFTTYCVNNLPDYFFTVPASSSGKYHPSYALGDGGLVRHTKAAVSIAHELFNLEMFPFTNDEQDLIIVSLILHDGLKQGDGNGKRTVFDHPIFAANFVKRCNIESQLLTDEQEAFVTPLNLIWGNGIHQSILRLSCQSLRISFRNMFICVTIWPHESIWNLTLKLFKKQ